MKKRRYSMSREEWKLHHIIDYTDEILYHLDCIQDGDYETDMDFGAINNLYKSLHAFRSDQYDQLIKCHNKEGEES